MSNYYFPAVAAVELGFLQTQGIDMELDMVFPVGRAMEALRDRRVDFVAGPAHATIVDSNPLWAPTYWGLWLTVSALDFIAGS